jgi:hypothetical protein
VTICHSAEFLWSVFADDANGWRNFPRESAGLNEVLKKRSLESRPFPDVCNIQYRHSSNTTIHYEYINTITPTAFENHRSRAFSWKSACFVMTLHAGNRASNTEAGRRNKFRVFLIFLVLYRKKFKKYILCTSCPSISPKIWVRLPKLWSTKLSQWVSHYCLLGCDTVLYSQSSRWVPSFGQHTASIFKVFNPE